MAQGLLDVVSQVGRGFEKIYDEQVPTMDEIRGLLGMPEDMSSDPAAQYTTGVPQPQRKSVGLLGVSPAQVAPGVGVEDMYNDLAAQGVTGVPQPQKKPADSTAANIGLNIDNELPADKYPSARAVLLGTISKEAGQDMRFNVWQGGGTDKKLAAGPGYGLFQTEMPHYWYKTTAGKKWTRMNPTKNEKRFKNFAGNTMGASYSKFVKENNIQDSAESQIKFMSNVIKKDKDLLKAFASNDYKKAMELFTAKIIRPKAYLNKKTRAAELKRRYRAAESFLR
jgi:hypothetical protein